MNVAEKTLATRHDMNTTYAEKLRLHAWHSLCIAAVFSALTFSLTACQPPVKTSMKAAPELSLLDKSKREFKFRLANHSAKTIYIAGWKSFSGEVLASATAYSMNCRSQHPSNETIVGPSFEHGQQTERIEISPGKAKTLLIGSEYFDSHADKQCTLSVILEGGETVDSTQFQP